MPARLLFGKRGNEYGLFVSKPGIDVRTALPGQELISPATSIYQIIAQGNTLVASGTLGPGEMRVAYVPLPGEFSAHSRLMMFGVPYYIHFQTGQVYYDEYWADYSRSTYCVQNGIVILSHQNLKGGSIGVGDLYIRWVIFREMY